MVVNHIYPLDLGLLNMLNRSVIGIRLENEIKDMEEDLKKIGDHKTACSEIIRRMEKAAGVLSWTALIYRFHKNKFIKKMEKARDRLYKKDKKNWARIDKFLDKGSDSSISEAASLAIDKGLNPQMGLDLLIESGEFSTAFTSVRGYHHYDRQEWGEYLIKGHYECIINKFLKAIKEGTGKDLKTIKLRELDITSLGLVNFARSVQERYEDLFMKYLDLQINYSNNPEMIKIGLELNEFNSDEKSYFDNLAFSLGRLEWNPDSVKYFLEKAERKRNITKYSRNAIILCVTHDKIEEAKQAADRLLDTRGKMDMLEILPWYVDSDTALGFAKKLLQPKELKVLAKKNSDYKMLLAPYNK